MVSQVSQKSIGEKSIGGFWAPPKERHARVLIPADPGWLKIQEHYYFAFLYGILQVQGDGKFRGGYLTIIVSFTGGLLFQLYLTMFKIRFPGYSEYWFTISTVFNYV